MIIVYLAMFVILFPLAYFNLVDIGVERWVSALIAWIGSSLFIVIVASLGAAIFAGDRRDESGR